MLTAADFPMTTLLAQRSKLTRQFFECLDIVNAAVVANTISNPDYQRVKFIVNRTLDEACDEARMRARKLGEVPYLGIPYVHLVEGMIRKLEGEANVADWLAVLREFLPLAQAMATLKGVIVKKTAIKAPNAAEVYRAPVVGNAALAMVQKVFRDVTASEHARLLSAIMKQQDRIVATYCKGRTMLTADEFYTAHGAAHDIMSRIVERRVVDRQPVYFLLSDAQDILRRRAERIAQEMQDCFVGKNVAKMASIVDAKGNLVDCKVISVMVDFASLQGNFGFVFADGSCFQARNSVVLTHSKYHKPFYRFPTTFHNVFLADGSKMKNVSEKTMNTVFAQRSA